MLCAKVVFTLVMILGIVLEEIGAGYIYSLFGALTKFIIIRKMKKEGKCILLGKQFSKLLVYNSISLIDRHCPLSKPGRDDAVELSEKPAAGLDCIFFFQLLLNCSHGWTNSRAPSQAICKY